MVAPMSDTKPEPEETRPPPPITLRITHDDQSSIEELKALTGIQNTADAIRYALRVAIRENLPRVLPG